MTTLQHDTSIPLTTQHTHLPLTPTTASSHARALLHTHQNTSHNRADSATALEFKSHPETQSEIHSRPPLYKSWLGRVRQR